MIQFLKKRAVREKDPFEITEEEASTFSEV